PLKEAIGERYGLYNHMRTKPENILVTAGATGGLECACKVFIEPGDECVLFAPIYQYHMRLVQERGGIPRFVKLRPPHWSFDSNDFAAAFSERTKLLILANPNNPTGKVFTPKELRHIGEKAREHNAMVVVDEVYEYLILDDTRR